MKKWGIIGALCFVSAVAVGYVFKFDSVIILQLGLSAFGFTVITMNAINYGKKNNVKTWVTGSIVVLAAVGGVLCCIGGLEQSIFEQLSGATLALLAVIFGILYAKKKQ